MYAMVGLFALLLHLPHLLGSSEHGVNADIHIQQFHHHSHHTDPSLVVFFFIEDLKLGNTIPIYFPTRDVSDFLPHLLSKQEADSIPFSLLHLPHLLHLFSFSPNSPQAKAMEETLQECQRDPIKDETKTCSTSWESMVQFLHTIFGSDIQIKKVSTTHIRRSVSLGDELLQKYVIMGIEQIPSPKIVACHTMPYAYTVFYCHYQDSESRVFRVWLRGERGDDEVEAIAVCHMDTSLWGPGHVAFKMLGVEPGSTPVCHFFPADNFVWVPAMEA